MSVSGSRTQTHTGLQLERLCDHANKHRALHRVLRTKPERIYRAFLDADAMVKWLRPNGFTGKVHRMEAKVGAPMRGSCSTCSLNMLSCLY
jgi:hypothetical protein